MTDTTHDAILDGIAGGPLVHITMREEGEDKLDRKGAVRGCSIVPTVERDRGGACMRFTGGYIDVPHVAKLELAKGTVIIAGFQLDSLASKSTLFAKGTEPEAGNFALEVLTTGAARAFLYTATDTCADLAGTAGDVLPRKAYTVALQFGSGGGLRHTLWDEDGKLVRAQTNATTVGIDANRLVGRIGAWPSPSAPGKLAGSMGHVILYGSRLDDGRVEELARALRSRSTYAGPVAWVSGKASDTWVDDQDNTVETQQP